ncbi:MAG TPA: Rieske 2Fe-2S domain-containing protein [Streptosporangiaceae bacterium]|nr:Rieske 2Fe-2S domain-containing protein [Streptosporangiaceae bacterium]
MGAGELRITSIGHAGLHVETRYGTILCDPWVNPAYFESWFVFPDNSGLDWDHFGDVDYLYVSHLHKDHFDAELLRRHVSRRATVLLPDFPVPDLREALERLGFADFVVLRSGEVTELGGLRLMGQALQSPADGPLGDSLLAVDDGAARILNQNDARPTELDALQSFGPYDVHLLQFSGAIWWPWTYELPEAAKRSFGAAKRANGLDRAARYVTEIGARHVVPFAGPPCFLDEELFSLNDLTGDPASTFPDQLVFLDYLRDRGIEGGQLLTPGAVLDVGRGHCDVRWPAGIEQAMKPFADKERYLRGYAERMRDKIAAGKRRWPAGGIDVLAELTAWFEPLLELADHIRTGVGGPVLLDIGDDQPIVIDFPAGQVRAFAGEVCRYQFSIGRPLVERLIADHQTDWVNSLFLSMRFRARRIGPYNEYVYTFFKCLSPERVMYAEGWYANRSHDEEEIQLGDWITQRRCPHMSGDLSRFGQTVGSILTCTMHGWQFDLATGRCLSSDDDSHRISSRPARPAAPGKRSVPARVKRVPGLPELRPLQPARVAGDRSKALSAPKDLPSASRPSKRAAATQARHKVRPPRGD